MMAVEIFNSDGVHTLRSHLSEKITLANRHGFFFPRLLRFCSLVLDWFLPDLYDLSFNPS